MVEAAARALREGRGNQYPPGPGVPELRGAISGHVERTYGRAVDPDREVLVTAGGTREPIDPVRYISNHSSGKQGFAIAEAARDAGANAARRCLARFFRQSIGRQRRRRRLAFQ